MTKEEIQSIFGSRIVSFHAVFAKAIGSVPAAVMLSQAFFWQEKAKSKDGVKIGEETFFSKTGEEWYDETGLTESQQLTARKHLLSAGFWMEQRAGLPAKMCYRIDVESLVAVISRYLKTGQQVAADNRKQSRELTRTSSGKFRQLEAEKNGNNIKVESKGELKGEEEEKEISSSASKPENFSLEAEKEKPIPPVAPSPLPATAVEVHEQGMPVVTVYDHIPAKQYPTQEPHGEYRRVNIGEEIDRLKTDYLAKENFTRTRRIPANLFDEYVEAFATEIGGTGETYPNVPAFRKHFFNWSGSRFEIAQRKAAQPKPQTSNGQPAKIRQL